MRIWVEPYYRVRFGKLEQVRGHWRWPPGLKPRVSLANAPDLK